jgi:pimeloyl-ACP methyl ester carboxylesterase
MARTTVVRVPGELARWMRPWHRVSRGAGRTMLIIVSVILACILGPVGLLVAWSPGKPKPFVDDDGRPLRGSISEKIQVPINGVPQGMFIKSKDGTNPVLLIVHGGPGMPEFFLTQQYPTGLEDDFTVVWWEQRGAGLSYSTDIPLETMTVEQFIDDTLAVTRYLRERFGKAKIYLLGHSWGSFIAIQAVARAPELYHAYIGMAQLVYQLESERLAYDYMLARFKENGNARMVRQLEAAPVTMANGTPDAYLAVRDDAMHSLGIGTTHDMTSVISGIVWPSLTSREHTLMEKVNIWRGRSFSRGFGIWEQVLRTDLSEVVPDLDVPVYFFHGRYDYTASYPLARDYLATLNAPMKGFYTFEWSAHGPVFEEPERARDILQRDVVIGANTLADPR